MGYDGDTYKLGDKYKDFNAIISCVYMVEILEDLDMKLCFYRGYFEL